MLQALIIYLIFGIFFILLLKFGVGTRASHWLMWVVLILLWPLFLSMAIVGVLLGYRDIEVKVEGKVERES